MAIQPFAMQAQTANFMLPSEAMAGAERLKGLQNQNAMVGEERQRGQMLDQAYRESGGDINKMISNPNLGFEAGTRLQSLSAENVKADAAAKAANIDQQLKMLDAGAQIVGGANDQASWDAARSQMAEMFGQEAANRLPAQYDPAAQQRLQQQSLSFKDKLDLQRQQLAMQREDRMFNQQDRMYQLAVGREGRLASAGSGDQKAPKIVTINGQSFEQLPDGSYRKPMVGGVEVAPKPAGKSGSGNLSATAQKELFEAEDMVMAGDNVKSAIDSALALNDKAYSGYGAGERATLRSNLPGQSEGADATVQMNNIILGQALESLKTTFGGAPTEGERAILVQLQASVDKTPAQRKAILEKAKELADKRINFNKKKASQLRSGEYLSEGGGSSAAEEVNTDDHSSLWN